MARIARRRTAGAVGNARIARELLRIARELVAEDAVKTDEFVIFDPSKDAAVAASVRMAAVDADLDGDVVGGLVGAIVNNRSVKAVRDLFSSIYQSLFKTGEKTREEAMDEAADQVNSLIDRRLEEYQEDVNSKLIQAAIDIKLSGGPADEESKYETLVRRGKPRSMTMMTVKNKETEKEFQLVFNCHRGKVNVRIVDGKAVLTTAKDAYIVSDVTDTDSSGGGAALEPRAEFDNVEDAVEHLKSLVDKPGYRFL